MGWTSWWKRKPKFDTSNVPKHIMPLINTKKAGPNCWNATILFFKPSEEIRYVSPEEMIDWIHANTSDDEYKLCRPGDIFAMSNEDSGLLHTAVWVAPGILFHKRGIANEWEFVTEKQIRTIYHEATIFHYRILKSETTNT